MKNRPVGGGAESFHANGRTDRQTRRSFSQFCEHAQKVNKFGGKPTDSTFPHVSAPQGHIQRDNLLMELTIVTKNS